MKNLSYKKNIIGFAIASFFIGLFFTVRCSTLQQSLPPQEATQSVFQTKVAKFPRLCPEYTPYFAEWKKSISPDGLWITELCIGSEYDGKSLTFSNKKTHTMWTIKYRDHVTPNVDADGTMTITHWSRDSRYVYFHTTLGGSAVSCFYSGFDSGVGLFQLNLKTGEVEEVLPLIKDNVVHYQFSFSPSGERLLYGVQELGLSVFDLTTGKNINVIHKEDFEVKGGYIWSPDSSQFVYSTEKSDGLEEYKATLRLVDIETGKERILLEADKNCYWAEKWGDNDILFVHYFTEKGEPDIMQYDLNSNTIIHLPSPPNQ